MNKQARAKRLLGLGLVVLLTGCKDLDIETDGNADEFRFGSPVHLWCTFKDERVPSGSGATATWRSDKQGEIGQGPDITVSNLQAGRHEIEVDVRYGDKKGKKKRKIKIVNDAPRVSIMSPGSGARLGVGKKLALVGSASDTEDGVIPAETLTWVDSVEGPLGAGAALEVSHLRPGNHEISLFARDKAGAQSSAKISVEITNEAPEVTISEPSGNATIRVAERLRLRGFALDRDHRIGPERVPGAQLQWVSDKDGTLGVGEDITVQTLSGGEHRIELVAKDEYGKAGKALVRVTVKNDPPVVDIRSPGNSSYFSASDEVRFEVDARDPEASLDENDIVWRSNKDGTLGRGYVLRTDRLTVGEHEVSCTVTDRHGASTVKKLKVLITNQAPTARIDSPSAGSSPSVVRFADVLTLRGAGNDAEDGALDGDRLEWTAVKVTTGQSYSIGKGANITQRVSQLVDRLGFGRLELRLVAKDRDGTASPTVTVIVEVQNRAPEVRISNPTAGASVAEGAQLLCSGYGQDPDRARLLEDAEVIWSARNTANGTTRELGRATRLDIRDLTAGTWELTLTGVDPDDSALRSTAKVTVTITPATTPTVTTSTTTTGGSPTTTSTTTGGIVGGIPGQ